MSYSNRVLYSPTNGRALYSPTTGRALYSGPAWFTPGTFTGFKRVPDVASTWNATNFAQQQTYCKNQMASSNYGLYCAAESSVDAFCDTSYGYETYAFYNFMFYYATLASGIRGNIQSLHMKCGGFSTKFSNPVNYGSYHGAWQNWTAVNYGVSLKIALRPYGSTYPANCGVLLGFTPDITIPFTTFNTANAAAGHNFSLVNGYLNNPAVSEISSYVDLTPLKTAFNSLTSDSFYLFAWCDWPSGNFPYLSDPAPNCANDFYQYLCFYTPSFLFSL